MVDYETYCRIRDHLVRQQLIELDLIAYRSPLYQVLALPGTVAAPRPAPRVQTAAGGQSVSLATLLQQAQQRRG